MEKELKIVQLFLVCIIAVTIAGLISSCSLSKDFANNQSTSQKLNDTKVLLTMPIYYNSQGDSLEVLLPFIPFVPDSIDYAQRILADSSLVEEISTGILDRNKLVKTYVIRDFSNINSLMTQNFFSLAYTETSIRMESSDSTGYHIYSEWFIIKKTDLDKSLNQRANYLIKKVMKENKASTFYHQFIVKPNPILHEIILNDELVPGDVPIHYSMELPMASIVSIWVEESGKQLSRISFCPIFLDDAILVHHLKVTLLDSNTKLMNTYEVLPQTDRFMGYSKKVMDELLWLYHSNRLYLRTQLSRISN